MKQLVATRLRGLVQTTGMVRKEVSQTLRQPQLLLLLVAGPFVILLIFGFGYDEDELAMRTRFVGPPDSVYETAITEHEDLMAAYLVSDGYSTDLVGAQRDLRDGKIDLVVVFPTEPTDRIMEGEQAPVEILHDKIDPIQVTAVEISARLAIGEVNATVLETLVERGLASLDSVEEELILATAMVEELEGAEEGDETVEAVTSLPPAVVVRPFVSEIARLDHHRVTPTDFFAPATIALLLAHLGVTFAAMSVVADRRLGVFEAYRVAPIRPWHILASKYVAFLILGAVVGAALIAGVVIGLDVPMVGSVAWVAGIVALVVAASVGIGLVVSALARTDSQAVQYAMLVLLAGLFFGGFFLSLDSFADPVRVLSAALPVSYGIEMLHDVMLRGRQPEMITAASLVGLTLIYAIVASLLMRWQLRAR